VRVVLSKRDPLSSDPQKAATVATIATNDRGNVAAVADVAASGNGAIIRDNDEDGGFVL
jgi:hypothetical protein